MIPEKATIKTTYGFFILFALLFFNSCEFQTKDNYIKNFSDFIQNVKSGSPNFTEEDWVSADLQFNKYTVEQYDKFKPELTEMDIETIGKLKGVYQVIKFKKAAKEAMKDAKDLIYQAQGAVEEVIDPIDN